MVGLLAVALVWGATFSAVKDAVESMPTTDFLAIRFTLAAAVLIALRPSSLGRRAAADRAATVSALGVLLGAGYLAQTVGLESIAAAASGVLTASSWCWPHSSEPRPSVAALRPGLVGTRDRRARRGRYRHQRGRPRRR